MPKGEPYIPETITVHLGRPDADAMNVEVPFEVQKYGFWILCIIAFIVTAVTIQILNKKGLLGK